MGDIEEEDENEESPLMVAVMNKHHEMVRELLEAGASVTHNFAVREDMLPEYTKKVLKKVVPEIKKHTNPPILYAAANNSYEIVSS